MNPELPPALQRALATSVAIQPVEVQRHVIDTAQRIQSAYAENAGAQGPAPWGGGQE